MVAEGAFGHQAVAKGADNDKIGIGRQQCAVLAGQADAPLREYAAKGDFGQMLGEGHHRSQAHRGRAADGNGHAQWFARLEGCLVMNADATVDLVMQAALLWAVVISAKLDAVHAEVGMSPTGFVGMLGHDLGQGDKGARRLWASSESAAARRGWSVR